MKLTKEQRRKRRHLSIRKKIQGTAERPRVVIFKSGKHIYGSVVVDGISSSDVLLTVSSLSKDIKKSLTEKAKGYNVEGAKIAGSALSRKAKEKGIEQVVFDRNGYVFTGRVKAFADAARKGGLKF